MAELHAAFVDRNFVLEPIEGCTCTRLVNAKHEPRCGLKPLGELVTPAHDALVQEEYGEAVADAIAESNTEILNHDFCYGLSCAMCAARHAVEEAIEIARTGDGVAAHLDGDRHG